MKFDVNDITEAISTIANYVWEEFDIEIDIDDFLEEIDFE